MAVVLAMPLLWVHSLAALVAIQPLWRSTAAEIDMPSPRAARLGL
jgi:hypothetical protein